MDNSSTTRVAAAGPPRLDSLQAARGVAALLVILFHCGLAIFSHPEYWPRDPFNGLFAWGNQGVELFFAISGFVILVAHRRDIGRPQQLPRYASKRFNRIYPTYWVVLLVLLPVYAMRPGWGGGQVSHPLVLLSSVLLVHLGTGTVVVAVSWTLFLEIVFYAAFAALLVGRRFGAIVLASWWALAVARLLVGPAGPLGCYLFAPYVLLFGFGMAAAALHRAERVRHPGAVALGGIAVFVGNGLLSAFHPVVGASAVTLLSGGASAAALLGLAGLERAGRLRVPGALLLLGDASYSIYLVHFPALSLAAKLLLPGTARALSPLPVAIAMVLLAVAAGLAFHLLVERRLIGSAARRTPAVALPPVGGRERAVSGSRVPVPGVPPR